MRRVATGLLVGAAALYAAATLYETAHPLVGYLRAFAEAAMVGALADWFAVSALFRRPLGLPIPHTAVIKRNKDRIGEALGRFVEDHFLSAEEIGARLAAVDFAALLARWLAEPGNRADAAAHLTKLLPGVLDAVPDEEVTRLAHGQLRDYLARRLQVAPLLGEALASLTADNRHQRLVDELLKQAVQVLKDAEPFIRERVSARSSWLWRTLSMDERVARKIMAAAEETLADVASDPAHAWRQGFDRAVREFIETLKTSEDYRVRGEALKTRLLAAPAVADVLAGLWAETKRGVRADMEDPDSAVRRRLSGGLAAVGRGLLEDDDLRAHLNSWLREVALQAAQSRRHEVSALITETVRAWDADTLALRIERAVGDDLQYIRINGTVIGGLAGLAIHAVSQLAL